MSEAPMDEIQDIFTKGSQELQEIFREIAAKAGWPEDIIGKVNVKMNKDGVNLAYDDAIDEQIFNLEYGKFGQPPAAAIRKLKEEALKKLKEVKTKAVFDELRKTGLF